MFGNMNVVKISKEQPPFLGLPKYFYITALQVEEEYNEEEIKDEAYSVRGRIYKNCRHHGGFHLRDMSI